ncbi:uncharacterized protein [Amphiura filiformis]|uniref:uncharacterized protein n=1 Tax=Amphiura filiformis TaxID=82378 RepID=UPI003B21DB6A
MERTLNAVDSTVVVEWEQLTAKDNDGDGDVQIQIQNEQYQSGEEFRAGEYTIVYIATDPSGNEGFCSFILTVNAYDRDNFWINCPDDIEIYTGAGLPYATYPWDPPELRAGVDRPRWSQTHSPGSTFVIGDTRVEYTAFDRADNSNTCAFTVTVMDGEAPVIISCPGDCTVYGLSGRDTVPVFWPDPRTSDNSGSTVSLSANPFGSGTEFGFGTHQVYYSAVDPSGNSASGCHFQITVVQPGDTSVVTGSAEFSSLRGVDSTSAIAEAANLADDLDTLFRQNTAISKILAGVQVGTPSPLSDGDVLVPFNLYFAECRAAFLHVRDSLTQNLQGNNRDSFDTNNVIYPDTFQLNTKEFLVSTLSIDQDLNRPVGQQELIFNGDYNNPRTSAYQNLAERVCDCMDVLFSSFTGYCGCDVWFFRQGSIVADLILIFADSSSVSQSAIYDQILNSIDTSSGQYILHNFVLEGFDLTTVTEVCPDGYCQNGGTCEPNAATYNSQCRCTTEWTGTQCQTRSGPEPETPTRATPTTGLTTEEIIGIVVGAVGGLLLLIILLACFCVFCLRPTETKPQPIIQEPPEPVYAVQQQQQDIFVRDVCEPPPIPRPVPVPVPDRFPVPVRVPQPVPVPRPVPRPFPVPFPVPVGAPVPVRVPVPQAVPRPYPVPIRQPFPVQQRIPVRVPVRVPVPTPVPVHVPVGVPVRENVPVLQPYGVGGLNRGVGLNGLNGGVVLNGGVPVTGFTNGLNGFNGLNGLNGFNSTRF